MRVTNYEILIKTKVFRSPGKNIGYLVHHKDDTYETDKEGLLKVNNREAIAYPDTLDTFVNLVVWHINNNQNYKPC